jgi:hypothetical protein
VTLDRTAEVVSIPFGDYEEEFGPGHLSEFGGTIPIRFYFSVSATLGRKLLAQVAEDLQEKEK